MIADAFVDLLKANLSELSLTRADSSIAGQHLGYRCYIFDSRISRRIACIRAPKAGDPKRGQLLLALERATRATEVGILSIPHSYRIIAPSGSHAALTNANRGVIGISIFDGHRELCVLPIESIATNRPLMVTCERLLLEAARDRPDRDVNRLECALFQTIDLWYRRNPVPQVRRLFRGSELVELADVTYERIGSALRLAVKWMLANLTPQGELPYKYWPSCGTFSSANNAIRQFMSTWCLGAMSKYFSDQSIGTAASLNLSFNLNRHLQCQGDHAIINDDGAIKLGAIAIASIAIRHSPMRQELAMTEKQLNDTIMRLWNNNGRFYTFICPDYRFDDNQNFYSGEALLAWAYQICHDHEYEILPRFMRSVRHYQSWHRSHRNPAFVPWHTQAYALVWELTEEPILRESIFHMNDWLLEMQQWDRSPFVDMMGRFYDPKHPEYGPPHASSTGVYLEGLADAYGIARKCGDTVRMKKYAVAIHRGLRSVLQLQFSSDVSQYYVNHRERTLGGIKTNVYDNTIRIDNIQHCAMAMLKVLMLADDVLLAPSTRG